MAQARLPKCSLCVQNASLLDGRVVRRDALGAWLHAIDYPVRNARLSPMLCALR